MPRPKHQLAPPKPPPAPAFQQLQQQQQITTQPTTQQSVTGPQTLSRSGSATIPVQSMAPGKQISAQPMASTISTTTMTSPSSSSTSSPSAPPIPPFFTRRKETVLAQLALPEDEYTDLSPKGTVDAGIRDLIDEINAVDGLVTTSSCAGRVSVFLEGRKGWPLATAGGQDGQGFAVALGGTAVGGIGGEDVDLGQLQLPGHPQADLVEEEDIIGGAGGVDAADARTATTIAGVGGKGGGGKWLFVSHDPVHLEGKLDSEPNIVGALLGMEEPIFDGRDGSQAEGMGDGDTRLIHFKFEPMILHVLTASPYHAQLILRCGLQAGFRESGAINLIPPVTASSSNSTSTATPIVAIRSMGLGLESLIGRETNGIKHCTVSGEYLKALIRIANERFVDNARRIERFRMYLRQALSSPLHKDKKKLGDREGGQWEDAETRKERKRAEGLKRAEEVRKMREELERQEREREKKQQEEEEKI